MGSLDASGALMQGMVLQRVIVREIPSTTGIVSIGEWAPSRFLREIEEAKVDRVGAGRLASRSTLDIGTYKPDEFISLEPRRGSASCGHRHGVRRGYSGGLGGPPRSMIPSCSASRSTFGELDVGVSDMQAQPAGPHYLAKMNAIQRNCIESCGKR
nr:hypothetical protein CFP56_25729 [Quercus suber]